MVALHRTTDIMSGFHREAPCVELAFTFFFLHVKQPPLDFLCGRFATKPVLRRGIVTCWEYTTVRTAQVEAAG